MTIADTIEAMSDDRMLMREAQSLSEAEILLAIARYFHHGNHFVSIDLSRARHYYEFAIAAGSAEAIAGLAILLLRGAPGVQSDPLQAIKLCEQAISQNNA